MKTTLYFIIEKDNLFNNQYQNFAQYYILPIEFE